MPKCSYEGPSDRPERLLRFSEVSSRTRLSKSEIYRRITAGTFPKSLKLGPRAVAWRESEIEGWIHHLFQDTPVKSSRQIRA